MKITEETKIKDLIPEGYEFEEVHIGDDDEQRTSIYFKKKQKDFAWYLSKYFGTTFFDGQLAKFNWEDYTTVPFEIKIGLLKFICDDNGIGWINMIQYLNYKYNLGAEALNPIAFNKVIEICPEGFLKSIIS